MEETAMSDILRLRFAKTGRAVYMSHLDLMRTMQRVFLRAGYSLKYSEGFNPHPLISILLPLGVGINSECEMMDFQLTQNTNISEMPKLLTEAMPEGLVALDVSEAIEKVKNLKWVRIQGKLYYDNRNPAFICSEMKSFFSQDRIEIAKKTKRGEEITDIIPAIHDISFATSEQEILLSAVISAQDPTLNPNHLMSSLNQLAPDLLPDYVEFSRIEIYNEKMMVFR